MYKSGFFWKLVCYLNMHFLVVFKSELIPKNIQLKLNDLTPKPNIDVFACTLSRPGKFIKAFSLCKDKRHQRSRLFRSGRMFSTVHHDQN